MEHPNLPKFMVLLRTDGGTYIIFRDIREQAYDLWETARETLDPKAELYERVLNETVYWYELVEK